MTDPTDNPPGHDIPKRRRNSGGITLRDVARLGYSPLPICIAKTQNSLSDDPARRGRPRDFDITVRAIKIDAGAGFLVVLTGDIMRMPGLPERPLAEDLDVRAGAIVGLS